VALRPHSRSVEDEARDVVERLGGRWGANGGLCRCPAHDDRTPSLSVRAGRARLLLHCFAGCTAGDILRALERDRLLQPAAAPEPGHASPATSADHTGGAVRLWRNSRSVEGTPAASYLAARGLAATSAALRYHGRAPHGPAPLTRYGPALIAAVRDECGLVAIHRTFLDPSSGRFARPLARAALGPLGRGAVRLGGAAPRLGLAEGIETAISATALFGVPCWATLGSERFRLVALPREVRSLMLFLDHDAGGQRAEQLAREAFAHVPCIEAHYPERPGDDWNDVLRASSRATTA